jgi:hypothetical protein
MEQAFSMLQKRMLAVAGLFLGGLGVEQFIQKVTRLNTALANTSGTLGVQAGTLRAYQQAAERFGLSGDAVTSGFGAITQQRSTFINTRQPGGIQRFQYNVNAGAGRTRNPLSVTNPDQTLMSDEEVTRRLSRWLEIETKAGRGVTGQAALRDIAGLPQEFVQFLAKGPKEIDRVLAETKKLAPTNAEIENFKKLNEAFESSSQSAQRLATILAGMIAPKLIEFFDSLGKAITVTNALITGDKDSKAQAKLLGDLAQKKKLDDFVDLLNKRGVAIPEGTRKEQERLADEIKKLRETLQRGGLQKSEFLGSGFNQNNVIPAMFSGGGARFGGGFGGRFGGGSGGGGVTPDVGAAKTGKLSGSRIAVAKAAMIAQLQAEGVPEANLDAAASALIGQALAESNLNPNAVHDGGTGYGIYGAGHGRATAMLDWLKKNGYSRNSLEGQAKYMAHEAMSGRYGPSRRALMGATSDNLPSVNHVLTDNFESPRVRNYGPRFNAARGALRVRPAGSNAIVNVPLPRPHPLGSNEVSMLMDGARFGGVLGAGGARQYDQSMTVGDVHIHTAATDARGIASSIRPALERFARVTSANNGPA